MVEPSQYSFQRYLSAKKSVDDRSLNRHVLETLLEQVRRAPAPIRVLEIGAGIGTMLERMLAWGLADRLDYTGIDAEPANVMTAWERLPAWAEAGGFLVKELESGLSELERGQQRVRVRFECADLFEYASRLSERQRCDLQIAHAFLDLMNIPATLPILFRMIRPGGHFYYTINFDGVTTFEPAIDPVFDARIEQRYHRTMDERLTGGLPSGDSRAGRHLFHQLEASGARLLAAGASDWVVYPTGGRYAHDEAYFLHFIVHTLHTALADDPELDLREFEDWIAARHAQIERAELVYIAHQLDFVGQPPEKQ